MFWDVFQKCFEMCFKCFPCFSHKTRLFVVNKFIVGSHIYCKCLWKVCSICTNAHFGYIQIYLDIGYLQIFASQGDGGSALTCKMPGGDSWFQVVQLWILHSMHCILHNMQSESDVNLPQCMPIIIHIWPPPPPPPPPPRPPPWPSLTTGGNCFLGHRLWIWVSRCVCQCCQGQLLDRLRGIRSWYSCNLFEKQVKVRICFLLQVSAYYDSRGSYFGFDRECDEDGFETGFCPNEV